MMKRLYGALVDGFGLEVGRELFEEANEGLRRAEEELEREEAVKRLEAARRAAAIRCGAKEIVPA
jgi:hypothetical protein